MHDDSPTICRKCAKMLTPGRDHFYVIHVTAYADASPPEFTEEEMAQDHQAAMRRAIAEAAHLSEREMLETVHRRMSFYLCPRCYGGWIEDPVGGVRGWRSPELRQASALHAAEASQKSAGWAIT